MGEEGYDGSTGVTADDGDGCLSGVGFDDAGEETLSADDVEGGDTEYAAGVEDACFFKGGGDDGDG